MVEENTQNQAQQTQQTQAENQNAQPLNVVEQAEKVLSEIKAENDRREKILQEEQKLHAERLLTGTAGSPIEQKTATPEELKKTAALEFWKGTPIADAISKQ